MRIRPVAARDVHTLAALQLRAWRAEYDGYVTAADMPTLEDRIVLWNGVRPGEAWLAEREGAIAGVVGVSDGEIAILHVEPVFAGDGTDALLLSHAEERLRDGGHTTALLWTFRENAVRRALYERHGWAADGAEQERRPGVCEVRYRKVL
jgi:GNAT superfamily N-acetyltransferase